MTGSSCKLQPCRKWNVQYMPVFGLPQTLPCDFQSNDVTSGSFLFTWVHVTSFPATWQPPASYSLEGSEMYSTRQFLAFYSHFQATSSQDASLPYIWGHVTSFPVTWLPPTASYSLVGKCTVYASFRPSQPLRGYFRSNDVNSGSPPVTWGDVMSFAVMWLATPASYSLVGSEMYSVRQFSNFHRHFQVTSSQMTSLPGHVR